MTKGPALFPYLNFVLQFCPTQASEKQLMARFATLGVGAGISFEPSPDDQTAIQEGIAAAWNDLDAVMKRINSEEVSSSDLFGTREFLKNNYLYRFTGAKLGLYRRGSDLSRLLR